jgi:LysR family glycine cleavage system transcriptional activator
MESARYPVISPGLLNRLDIRTPEDLLQVTLMHDEVADAWAEWFANAGVADPQLPRGPIFPNCELTTTAAERGQGVSLAYDTIVRDTIAEGRLIRLFDTVTMPIVIYSVAYPEARAQDAMVREFRDWIFGEAAMADETEPEALAAM